MILGLRRGIDPETKRSYQRAGAIHILAISGLHIGIIGGILMALLGNPVRTRSAILRGTKCALIIMAIWIFTMISGMSPSACRAACMFSIYLTGVAAGRRSHSLNILGFSAILFLILQPYLLYSISFQFSYLAILGIVALGIPLTRVPVSRIKILQYTWNTIAVSVGAQIFLAPLIIMYFGEISIASPLSSLFAIPAAFVIVAGALAMLVAGAMNMQFGDYIGSCVAFVVDLANRLVDLVSSSSFSTITSLHITSFECAMLLGVLLLICTRAHFGGSHLLWFSLLFAGAFCSARFQQRISVQGKFVLTVYRSDNIDVDIFRSGKCVSTIPVERSISNDVRKNRAAHYIGRVFNLQSDLPINEIRLATRFGTIAELIFTDTHYAPRTVEVFGQDDIVVLTTRLPWWRRKQMTGELLLRNIRAHDLTKEPFQITIK